MEMSVRVAWVVVLVCVAAGDARADARAVWDAGAVVGITRHPSSSGSIYSDSTGVIGGVSASAGVVAGPGLGGVLHFQGALGDAPFTRGVDSVTGFLGPAFLYAADGFGIRVGLGLSVKEYNIDYTGGGAGLGALFRLEWHVDRLRVAVGVQPQLTGAASGQNSSISFVDVFAMIGIGG